MEQKNIVLIFTDQHRKDTIGCYGSEVVRTPNIDGIAEEGTVFENAYSVYPVCTPARASLQTGLYPVGHGMQNNMYQPGCVVHELADTEDLLSRRLVEYGYSAGHTGKWHLGFGSASHKDPWYTDPAHDVEGSLNTVTYPDFYRVGSSLPTDIGYEGDDFPGHGGGGHSYKQYQDYLEESGLEHILKEPGSSATEVLSGKESTVDYFLNQRAMHFVKKFSKREKPFYFELNFWGPHTPAYVPSEFYDRFRNMTLVPWPSFNEDQSTKPSIHSVKRNRRQWKEVERTVKHVYAYCEFIDDEIGRLVQEMKSDGTYDDSYIIISTDHGDSLGCHDGLFDKGFHMYEETTHIPLIIKPPKGMEVCSRVEALVNTTDIYSTILDIAGVAPEIHERDGRSVLPLMLDETYSWRREVVTEFTGLGYSACTQRMIRVGDWKYVFTLGDKEELYNLVEDPYEMDNRADDNAVANDVLEIMRAELIKWMEKHMDRFMNDFKTYITAKSDDSLLKEGV